MPFGTPYSQQPSTKTADYTLVAADDLVLFNPVAAILTATLPTPNGAFSGDNVQGGVHRIANVGTNVLAIAAAAGSIVGPSLLYPGQQAVFVSDGVGTWFCDAPPPTAGNLVVAISSANFLALNTTPISLIATPGAGRTIIVDHITFKMTRTATAYANGGALEWRYTDASGAKVTADVAASVVTTGGAAVEYNGVRGITTSLVAVVNAPIVLRCATADFITGTGTATATLNYRVV